MQICVLTRDERYGHACTAIWCVRSYVPNRKQNLQG